MSSNNHPLPAAPGQQQQRPQQQRQRAKSSFSFHSHKSSGSGQKIDLHESHEEKQSKRLTTHADPSMAMTEAEPSAVAREKSSLASIRAIQHRDHMGNPIADPDRSNPTRSRWERPLDTIRSFEAAIDGNYSRKSYIRTETDGPANFNRRSSYFGGTQATTAEERSRFPQNSYYGGRPQSFRPDSYVDGRSSYYNSGDNGGPNNGGPSNGYYPNRARYPRTASEPQFSNGQSVYPGPANQQSYETVTTASGSGSSDPAGYSTDPSSENSSTDRITALPVKDPGEQYGFIGFNGGDNSQYTVGGNLQEQRQGNAQPAQRSTVLRKESTGPRVPIKLGQTSGNAGPPPTQRPSAGEKRKSWLGRRFSKAG